MKVNLECPYCAEEIEVETEFYQDPYLDCRVLCGCCEEIISFDLEPSFVAVTYDSKYNH